MTWIYNIGIVYNRRNTQPFCWLLNPLKCVIGIIINVRGVFTLIYRDAD